MHVAFVTVFMATVGLLLRITVFQYYGNKGKIWAWVLGIIIIALTAYITYFSPKHYYCNGKEVSITASKNCNESFSPTNE